MIPGWVETVKGAVSGIFGSEGISGLIDNITTNKEEKGEIKAKLDTIKNNFETKVMEIALEQEKLVVEREKAILEDLANARKREGEIATNPNASWITRNTTAVLALSFVGVTLLLYTLSVLKAVDIHENILRDLRDIVILIMGYYFGSSLGSKMKQERLDNLNK